MALPFLRRSSRSRAGRMRTCARNPEPDSATTHATRARQLANSVVAWSVHTWEREPDMHQEVPIGVRLEAATGVEPVMEVLQTSALPLGYAAPAWLLSDSKGRRQSTSPLSSASSPRGGLERVKGLEPSTFCMASRRSSQLSYTRSKAGCYQRARWGAIRSQEAWGAAEAGVRRLLRASAGPSAAADTQPLPRPRIPPRG